MEINKKLTGITLTGLLLFASSYADVFPDNAVPVGEQRLLAAVKTLEIEAIASISVEQKDSRTISLGSVARFPAPSL